MKRTFRHKLLTLFIISSTLPMMAIASLASSYYVSQHSQISQQNIMNTLYTVSENIHIYLDDLKRVSISPNVFPGIMEYYSFLNSNKREISYENYLLGYNYRALMQRMLTLSRRDIRGVAFIPYRNSDKKIYVIDTQTGTVTTSMFDYSASDWYNNAMQMEGAPVFAVSSMQEYYGENNPMLRTDTRSEGLFSVTRVVYSNTNHAIIGTIKIDASDTVIQDIFSRISTSENSGLLLTDQNGNLICSSTPKFNDMTFALSQTNGALRVGSDSYNCYTQIIESSGWHLTYLDSTSDVWRHVREIYFFSTLIALLCAAAGLVIFNHHSRRFAAQVHSIIQTMRLVETGDMSAKNELPDYTNREFTMISDELNNMIAKLNDMINREYKAVISQKNAEFLALQTQVNPHFLYNTLNGMVTLNRLESRKKLEDAILQLTALFRYTCNNTNNATIKEEFHFLTMYLALQQLRFEERLQYRINIDKEAEDMIIPRLLIQPLVENALIHGMEPSPHPFLLEMDAMILPDSSFGRLLMLSVKDNGVGFNMEHCTPKKRVGLKNVEERLVLFRSSGVFVLKSAPGKGTHAVIIMPCSGEAEL